MLSDLFLNRLAGCMKLVHRSVLKQTCWVPVCTPYHSIPEAQYNYVLCGEQRIVTVEHLSFECEALKAIREVAVKFYKTFELSIQIQ